MISGERNKADTWKDKYYAKIPRDINTYVCNYVYVQLPNFYQSFPQTNTGSLEMDNIWAGID